MPFRVPPCDVLICALAYPPANYAGAARPARFAKYLERLGYRVAVVAGGVSEQCGWHGNALRVRAEMDGDVRRSPSWLLDVVVRRMLLPHEEGIGWVPRVVRACGSAGTPVLLSTSPPLTTHLAAWWMKRLHGWPWIADFRDPVLGNPYRSPRTERADLFLEPRFFRDADALIANTDAAAELWRTRYPQWRDKIHVIWNGFDPDDVEIVSAPAPQRSYRLLSHVGSLYGDRYPAMLIAAIGRLVKRSAIDPAQLRVQLAGPFSEPRGSDASLAWLEFIPGLLPRVQANQLFAQADVSLLLDVTNAAKGEGSLQVPGKLFDYVRRGRPILACTNRGSPADRILARAGVPYACVYPSQTPEEHEQSILQLLNESTSYTPPSEWFVSQFSAPAQAAQLAEIIDRLRKHSQSRR